ncbi:AMP-binding protein [Hydrogenophaga sp. BPS33]|uniref:AMP-binding protein n=1 Tax=Hydrogenophaga sp. BPS33 TaxID=2651974 RepID=UPI0013202982|nr:AMP-binding protein [Hydrogenophaga sp. BPS33]QHE83948.1 AMP-binding protein [Hydrogenophaga sp. BPS33]
MPSIFDLARAQPEKVAVRFLQPRAELRFRELAQAAADAAAWMVSIGLQGGETIALLCENRVELLAFALGARRVGLYYTPVSTHAKPRELAHILRNSGARALVASANTQALAVQAGAPGLMPCFLLPSEQGDPALAWPAAQTTARTGDLDDGLPARCIGRDFLYSSGTTGQPSGIRKPMLPWDRRHEPDPEVAAWQRAFGFDAESVYFSAAPLYHAAPLRYAIRVLECGGTCVLMDRFDAEQALQALCTEGITHSQWVPTMFVRMLALPAELRERWTPSGMRVAIHAAAPCAPHVKRAMIAWWGPIVHEYYAGSEGVGMTAIDSHEWLAHPGSVGRARVGVLHITDESGRELPTGEDGVVWFEGGPRFEYVGDPEKTARAYNDRGWATYGDIGHVDAEGYLTLSDRRADLILCGGVNVYPREIEDVLGQHPDVADVAVVGVPDADMGAVPVAFVQPRAGVTDEDALRAALVAHGREHLSSIKLPRRFEFRSHIPRLESGKLLRRALRDEPSAS